MDLSSTSSRSTSSPNLRRILSSRRWSRSLAIFPQIGVGGRRFLIDNEKYCRSDATAEYIRRNTGATFADGEVAKTLAKVIRPLPDKDRPLHEDYYRRVERNELGGTDWSAVMGPDLFPATPSTCRATPNAHDLAAIGPPSRPTTVPILEARRAGAAQEDGKGRRGLIDRGDYGDDGTFGPGDYGWGTDLTTTTITVDATSYNAWTTVYTVYEGVDTTVTLTPNVATFTIYPTATRYETSVITEQQTTYETQTSVFTATLQESTTVTETQQPQTQTVTLSGVEPEETITSTSTTSTTQEEQPGTVVVTLTDGSTSTETLATTPPDWLTLTSTTSASHSSATRTTTKTTTAGAEPTRSVPAQSECLPGDEDVNEKGMFDPTKEQQTTLYVMAIYLVGITICWNFWGLRAVQYGFKSFTVFIHETGHVLGVMLSGQPLYRFTIDPNAGGATHTTPGRLLTPLGLFLGQLFSILFGGVMVFVGFDTLASKYASFVIMALWLPVIAMQKNVLSAVVCAASLGLLIGIWFIEHAAGLRYYILFLGIMSSFYILWDTMDDFFHRKQNECCVVMLESNTAVPAMAWFAIWFLLSVAVLIGSILGALAYWRETPHAMYCQGQSFAPT
ncbi:hypothetical protein JCM8547_005528 [Rhodosporidiobolus lusitaniae]